MHHATRSRAHSCSHCSAGADGLADSQLAAAAVQLSEQRAPAADAHGRTPTHQAAKGAWHTALAGDVLFFSPGLPSALQDIAASGPLR